MKPLLACSSEFPQDDWLKRHSTAGRCRPLRISSRRRDCGVELMKLKMPMAVVAISVVCLGSAAAAVVGYFGTESQLEEPAAIPSTAEGALLPPEAWNCELYATEYREWLESGNAAGDWRFEGKTYQDVGTNSQYSWSDWLNWHASAGCEAGPAVKGESAALLPVAEIVGGIVGTTGAAQLAAGAGSNNPDSPG